MAISFPGTVWPYWYRSSEPKANRLVTFCRYWATMTPAMTQYISLDDSSPSVALGTEQEWHDRRVKDHTIIAKKIRFVALRSFAKLKNSKNPPKKGSFHVKSTDFWPFFHGPPPILLKFCTLVGIVYKLTYAKFFLSRSSEFRDMGVWKMKNWRFFRSNPNFKCL